MSKYQAIIPSSSWPQHLTFSPRSASAISCSCPAPPALTTAARLYGPGDIVAQTRRIFEKFSIALQSVGADLGNIVETTDYVLSLEDYKKTAGLRRELFKGPPWPRGNRRRGERTGPRRRTDRNQGYSGALITCWHKSL